MWHLLRAEDLPAHQSCAAQSMGHNHIAAIASARNFSCLRRLFLLIEHRETVMSDTLQKADATGKLELANEVVPMPYDVTVAQEKEDGKYIVKVSVSAPRDWLLKRGFKSSATLVKEDGRRIELHHNGELDVSEAISVELSAIDRSCGGDADLQKQFPELRV
jgi:predicted amidophosphoribosyltransferase